MKKIIPIFGPQELFDGCLNDVVCVSKNDDTGEIFQYTSIVIALRDLTKYKGDSDFTVAHRRIEEAQYSDASEKEIEDLISDRDRWESKATELAHGIAEKFGTDFGEHSSANCPVQNAIDFVFDLESTERIINEPKRWTVADQKAGLLPDVGAGVLFNKDESLDYFYPVDGWLDGDELNVLAHVKAENGCDCVAVYNSRDKYTTQLVIKSIKPIETPAEKATRLNADRVKRMVELFEEKACHQTYNMERGIEAVVNALTKELLVKAKDGA